MPLEVRLGLGKSLWRYTPDSAAARRAVGEADRRNWVEPAVVPRMAARQPTRRQPTTPPSAVSLQGLDRVCRTRRIKAAMLPEQRAQGIAIHLNERNQESTHRDTTQTTRLVRETLPHDARVRASGAGRNRGLPTLLAVAGKPLAPGAGCGFVRPHFSPAASARPARCADSRSDLRCCGARIAGLARSGLTSAPRQRRRTGAAEFAVSVRRSSNSEARAPFRPAGSDHRSAAAGSHPDQETVGSLAPDARRLVGALHGIFLTSDRTRY